MEPGLSIADFQALLAERTGVAAGQQEVLTGFPPAPLQVRSTGARGCTHCTGALKAS